MPANPKASARRFLREGITKIVIPALGSRGFVQFSDSKGSPPHWDLHRLRDDGGFDLISIGFVDGYRPLFDATINVAPAGTSVTSWGEKRAINEMTAIDLHGGVEVAGRVFQNRTIRAMMRFWGIGWFGFSARNNNAHNKQAAENACAQFIVCLDQAERWWRDGSLGPNLVMSRSGGVAR